MKNEKTYLSVRFGLRCKQLRAGTCLSQLEFSELIGMDRSYYASIEAGDRNVTLVSMAKIASGFGVSLSALLDGVRLAPPDPTAGDENPPLDTPPHAQHPKDSAPAGL